MLTNKYVYQVLEANGTSASGGVLILVSDGKQNEGPTIERVTPTLMQKSVTVHTILISGKADMKMINLATNTRGRSFFDSGSINTTDLLSAFKATVDEEDSGSPGAAPVEVSVSVALYWIVYRSGRLSWLLRVFIMYFVYGSLATYSLI